MYVWGTANRCGSSPYEGHPGGGVRAHEEKGHRPKNRADDEKSEATFLQGGDHRRMCYMSNTPIGKDAEKKDDILVEQPRLTEAMLQPI